MSLRSQWCAVCERAGHRCPAAAMRERSDGGGEYPVCLDCLNERPCAVKRVGSRGRDGSSVQIELNIWAEEITASTQSEVVHRTPEELGIPRTVVDRSATPAPAVKRAWPADSLEGVKTRMVRGVRVRMSPHAVMGAELLEEIVRRRDDKRNSNRKERRMAVVAVGGGQGR